MNSGDICKRTLVLDTEWISPEDSEPSEDEDEDDAMLDFHGSDGDDEDGVGDDNEDEDEDEEEESEDEGDDEDEQEESEVEPPPLPSKRKRPAEPSRGPKAPPKKRVAFDLQKPVRGVGLPSKPTPPKPDIKSPTLVSKKRR
jgi:hypothetical protein